MPGGLDDPNPVFRGSSGMRMKYFVPHKATPYGEASRNAIYAYADAIEDENTELAEGLRRWVATLRRRGNERELESRFYNDIMFHVEPLRTELAALQEKHARLRKAAEWAYENRLGAAARAAGYIKLRAALEEK